MVLAALRGSGAVGDPDIVYGSATRVPPDQETLVGLQEKALFVLNVLQGADVRPTTQAIAAAEALEQTMAALVIRWEAIGQGVSSTPAGGVVLPTPGFPLRPG